ncbi:ion channel protein [Agromyces aerolatus]|uniref:ion channel protein n=1 Tax=Agromyces sp. LY-1074 TaxID=3074080 RepID=UPI00286611CA|nr:MULTISPECIES: ion channel protein [unclassified Agromyces]MDR5701086.1 ion channel protein [Agromyces sp. LY-1074]MDR5707726.1 ion channel protein [Agromyces sp. LY-1358]
MSQHQPGPERPDASQRPELPTPTPRQLLVLSVPAILVGAATGLILWTVDRVSEAVSDVLWTALPDAIGVDPSGWWILLVLTATGLAVGLCLRFLPGHGGPDSATTELMEPPLPLRTLPGLAIVLLLALAGGVSLGPENPIIAINVALTVAVLARLMPAVTPKLAMLMAAAGTIGALFGTPVGAALLFTGTLAAIRGGGALWDKLFLPLASAAAGSVTMHLLGQPPLSFTVPQDTVEPVDFLLGIVLACVCAVIGLGANWLFPWVHRTFHALRNPILIPTVGGIVLGVLGMIGGPITMFKGLSQMGELIENVGEETAGDLALIAAIKIVALLVAASAAFRGGRVFPAAFIGVALGLLAHALLPTLPIALAIGCGLIGILLVVTRDGWMTLFLAAAVCGDLALLPWFCVIVLPAWLLVSRAPEFRIVPAGGADAPASPSPRA